MESHQMTNHFYPGAFAKDIIWDNLLSTAQIFKKRQSVVYPESSNKL
jgi:hypothetical protein